MPNEAKISGAKVFNRASKTCPAKAGADPNKNCF